MLWGFFYYFCFCYLWHRKTNTICNKILPAASVFLGFYQSTRIYQESRMRLLRVSLDLWSEILSKIIICTLFPIDACLGPKLGNEVNILEISVCISNPVFWSKQPQDSKLHLWNVLKMLWVNLSLWHFVQSNKGETDLVSDLTFHCMK